jgi:hypothetical protein
MSPSLKFFLMAPIRLAANEVCREFVLGDVPATIPVENLSAAMALVSLDSPLPVQSRHFDRRPVTSVLPPNFGHIAAPHEVTLCAQQRK